MKTLTQEIRDQLAPEQALQLLIEGNQRFCSGKMLDRALPEQVRATAGGQFPHSAVLSCIDSRASAELIFDQGVGDVFSARVAGNVLNEDLLGSLEFACHVAGSRLLVVLGHTSCGAVKGACAGVELGHLTGLLQKIQPAIDATKATGDPSDDGFADRVAAENVQQVIREMRKRSSVLDGMISSGQIGIVGAMYSVETGAVEFQEMICGS